jgi:hypothetical protein
VSVDGTMTTTNGRAGPMARKKGGIGVLGIVAIIVLALLLLGYLKQHHIAIQIPGLH